jgi:hypothetical protein
VLHVQLTKIMFVLISWHLLSGLLHCVHIVPWPITFKQGMCVEVTNMERHGVILLQMDSPWKCYNLCLSGLRKTESKQSNLLLMYTAARIKHRGYILHTQWCWQCLGLLWTNLFIYNVQFYTSNISQKIDYAWYSCTFWYKTSSKKLNKNEHA